MTEPTTRRESTAQRASIVRTAWILASIALVFFAGVIASKWIGDTSIGMTVVGAAVFLYLLVSIGRHLWSRK
jgi:hypothetical protein